MHRRSLLTSLPVISLSLSLSAPLAGQTSTSRGEIIALTHRTPLLVSQQMDPANGCPGVRCAPGGFEPRLAAAAGGTAYNGRTHGAWISNGSLLAEVDADSCRYLCKPQKAPFPVPPTLI